MKTKLCNCGCGLPAPIATVTRKKRGYIKGKPLKFRRGHHRSSKPIVHGHSGGSGRKPSKEYIAFQNIGQRCRNPKNPAFKNYGGRGISLELTFPEFLSEVGLCPDRRLTIERLDNGRGYCRGNLTWATRAQQIRNRRPLKRRRAA